MLKSNFLFKNKLLSFKPTTNQNFSNFFFRELLLRGVGFKFAILKNTLFLRLGFSHYIAVDIPTNLQVRVRKDRLVVFGSNLVCVSTFCSLIRDLRPPDSYKFKGVSFATESVVVKVGKQR